MRQHFQKRVFRSFPTQDIFHFMDIYFRCRTPCVHLLFTDMIDFFNIICTLNLQFHEQKIPADLLRETFCSPIFLFTIQKS